VNRQSAIGNYFGQRFALDELHGVMIDAAFAAGAKDGDDVGVLELGGGLGFDLEALKALGVEGGGTGEEFDGDAEIDRDLGRLVDEAHAAAVDFADNAVIAEGAGDWLAVGSGGQKRSVGGGFTQVGQQIQGGEQLA